MSRALPVKPDICQKEQPAGRPDRIVFVVAVHPSPTFKSENRITTVLSFGIGVKPTMMRETGFTTEIQPWRDCDFGVAFYFQWSDS